MKKRLKLLRKRSAKVGIFAALGLISFILAMNAMGLRNSQPEIDPAAFRPLLDTIGKGESGGNYNAYFGNAANAQIQFTTMTVAEVMQWQAQYVAQGSASSAVGKYQFLRSTLAGLVRERDINPRSRFNEKLQDTLAIALLERRGAVAFVEKKLSREQFAANLAQEWAAFPRITGPNPGASYYAGDGLNQSRLTPDEVFAAIDSLRASRTKASS